MFLEPMGTYAEYRKWCRTVAWCAREAGMSYVDAYMAMEAMGINVYSFPFGEWRASYLVPEADARRFVGVHGTLEARAERRRKCKGNRDLPPLDAVCPQCGMKEKQWRAGFNRPGRQKVRCGHCRLHYTLGARQPLEAKCPRCGSTVRQNRHKFTASGKRRVWCRMCGRYYTIETERKPAEPKGRGNSQERR